MTSALLGSIGARNESVQTIAPVRGWSALQLFDLWRYRDLLYFLVWRDIKVRYKQTAIGAAWAILQPLLLMIVVSLFLGRFGRLPSGGVPYPIFVYCALLPWQLFVAALTQASNSLVASESLITKVYFPRLLIPLAAALSSLVDFFCAGIVMLLLMAYYGFVPHLAVFMVPLLTLLAFLAAVGPGLWFAAMSVRYRDVRHAIPLLAQLWLFATPVMYSLAIVPPSWLTAYSVNPMAGIVESFRWALLGTQSPSVAVMAVSLASAALILVSGLFYFRRLEASFADVI